MAKKDNIVTQDALTTIAKALKDDADSKLNALSVILDRIIVKATYDPTSDVITAPRTVLNAMAIILEGYGSTKLYIRKDDLYDQYIDEGMSVSTEIWAHAPQDTYLAGIFSREFYRTDDSWGDGQFLGLAVFIDNQNYDQYYVKIVEV